MIGVLTATLRKNIPLRKVLRVFRAWLEKCWDAGTIQVCPIGSLPSRAQGAHCSQAKRSSVNGPAICINFSFFFANTKRSSVKVSRSTLIYCNFQYSMDSVCCRRTAANSIAFSLVKDTAEDKSCYGCFRTLPTFQISPLAPHLRWLYGRAWVMFFFRDSQQYRHQRIYF